MPKAKAKPLAAPFNNRPEEAPAEASDVSVPRAGAASVSRLATKNVTASVGPTISIPDFPKALLSSARLNELNKESLDRLARLTAVVKKWKCAHCSTPVTPKEFQQPTLSDLGTITGTMHLEQLPVKQLVTKRTYLEELNKEVQLFLANLNLNNRDKWELFLLQQQTQVANELYDRRIRVTKGLVQRLDETELILGKNARRRVEVRRLLHETHKGAEKCYEELDRLVERQNQVIHDFDKYADEITLETDRIKAYAAEGFPSDLRKCQVLSEHRRLNEDNFEELHKVEMNELRKQMKLIKSDLTRLDPNDYRKHLQKLCLQIRNLKYEPISCERELLQSDISVLEAKLTLLKNDVAFMQERFIKLIYSEDPYSSRTELYLLWAVVPDEKRYFSDPPFIKEFYSLIGDFVLGFVLDFPEESYLKFAQALQWNTLVYEDDILAYKYTLGKEQHGYHKLEESDVIVSEEQYEDGTPHLQLQVDDEDRRLFTVWNMVQLANIIAVTEKTWDMEIASVLYFQPDPIDHIFANKCDLKTVQQQHAMEAVSKVLQDMESDGLEPPPYQRLYMLLQQFDLLYLYRKLFMNFRDDAYVDPNLPYREIGMLQEMAEYGEDAPLKGAGFLYNAGEWGWAAPLHRQAYGDVAFVVVITHDCVQHCLTINVTGIYENDLLCDENDFGAPSDSDIKTIVMWLKTNDQYFREHFVRASFRYDTRLEMTRSALTEQQTKEVNVVLPARKYIAMDSNHKFFLLDHLESNPIIKRKGGFWLRLRQVHKNLHAANRVLYKTVDNKSALFKQKLPPDEILEEEKRVEFLTTSEVLPEGSGMEDTTQPGILRLKTDGEQYFPESFSYDPKTKLAEDQTHVTQGEANSLPEYWPMFRVHRLMRFGCPSSVAAGAMLVHREDQIKESNAPVFHHFPVVEAALNMCEVTLKEYGRQKYECLELLTRLANCKFTLRQINFFNGIKAIIQSLRSRYLEVKAAASVCLATLMEMHPNNRQILGRDGGLELLLETMKCTKVTAENYWFYNDGKKYQRRWPEEILIVTASQAAQAVWLALRERRNRHNFVALKGIPVCKDLLQSGLIPEYAAIPVTGIFSELARERQFHTRIIETGALKSLCKVLQQTSNENVFQNTASVIALLCENDAAREEVRQSGGLQAILKSLKESSYWSNPGCMQMATEALYKSSISLLNCEVYLSNKALETALDRLYQGSGETVVFSLLGFLGEMARLQPARMLLRSGGALPFIMDYIMHDNQYIRMKAAVATGRMGADKDSYNMVVEAHGITNIWNLLNPVYAPIVCVHGCMAVYPLFVANPKETAKTIKTIINPFATVFVLLEMDDARVVDAVLNLICLLAQDDDLLAIMSDLGFCTAIARHIDTKNIRLLRFVTEAVAVGSEYAINRINFSTTEIIPKIARLLWHADDEVQSNALSALYELTKYPQNIIQIHSDKLVRRLLSYLMEGSESRAKKASGCLKHMRYLAMANMGDNYNFEDTYFPLRSEEQKAIDRTKRELLTKKLVPEAKAEADKMIQHVQNEKKQKMQFMPLPPEEDPPQFLLDDRKELPSILRKSVYDPDLDGDVPPPPEPDSVVKALRPSVREKRRDSTHVRNDKRENDWRLAAAPPKPHANQTTGKDKEWWTDEFDEENHKLFNRLTIRNNYLDDNVERPVVFARPYRPADK